MSDGTRVNRNRLPKLSCVFIFAVSPEKGAHILIFHIESSTSGMFSYVLSVQARALILLYHFFVRTGICYRVSLASVGSDGGSDAGGVS